MLIAASVSGVVTLSAALAQTVPLSPSTDKTTPLRVVSAQQSSADDGSTDQAPKDENAEGEAVAFIQDVIDRAGKALTNEEADDAKRLADFQDVLREALALPFLSKFMIGLKAYDQMNDEQRTRYNAIFPEYITRQYAKQFEGILGQPLEVTDTKSLRNNIFVRTQFIRQNGTTINVDWRTRPTKEGGHEIRDIIVNSNSIMRVKRREFEAVLEREGIDGLINILIEEVNSSNA